MRETSVRAASAGVLVALALVLGGCARGSAGAPASAASLVVDRCTRCHSVARIKRTPHDAKAWGQIVERMRSKGAQLSDAEASAVVGFLADGGASRL